MGSSRNYKKIAIPVRTLETTDGKVFFCGADVAMVLGYVKPLDALSRHVDEDDSVKYGLTDKLGREQETILINESGLYSLILSSKLPNAKKFKHWVTSEVLPTIRKKGSYTVPQMSQTEIIAAMANNAVELEKRIVLAWDSDYTKLTPKEAKELTEAENSGYVDEEEIDWDNLEKYQ
uniref:Bro-N domain-containing protein n=1 Tax=uncultured prokaryote TaxID=198431 RepID=A0A0H5PXP3_9ZZZZ|nr:hypothetical protein [uncultured prokaryote]